MDSYTDRLCSGIIFPEKIDKGKSSWNVEINTFC